MIFNIMKEICINCENKFKKCDKNYKNKLHKSR